MQGGLTEALNDGPFALHAEYGAEHLLPAQLGVVNLPDTQPPRTVNGSGVFWRISDADGRTGMGQRPDRTGCALVIYASRMYLLMLCPECV